MTEPLHCAECKVEMTATDLEFAVPTEAGPVHRECFEGPLPPSVALDAEQEAALERAQLEAENQRRREMGDSPVDTQMIGARCVEGDHDLCRADRCDCGCHRDADDGLDRRDPEDERGLREAAEEEGRSIR